MAGTRIWKVFSQVADKKKSIILPYMAGTRIWEVFSKVANNFWAGILKSRQQIGRYLRSRQFENTAK